MLLSHNLVPATDAAERLGVSAARVRALIAAGTLGGTKVGGRWFVQIDDLRRREVWGPAAGRPLEPTNAWSALTLASGGVPSWTSSETVRRLVALLDEQGLRGLAPRMGRRASSSHYFCHPGALPTLANAGNLHPTGVSAAHEYDVGLVGGGRLDAYVAAGELDAIVADFALDLASPTPNVSLRLLPPDVERLVASPLPRAAIALDLAESSDARGADLGMRELFQLDREQRWRRAVG